MTDSTARPDEVTVLIGSGAIGQAIARRVSVGTTLVLADIDDDAARAVAAMLSGYGFNTRTAHVDVSSADSVAELADFSAGIGEVVQVIHTAGLSPSQASASAIIAVDLIGTALVLESFGAIIGRGGSGLVVASQAGHMVPGLPPELARDLATVPAARLSELAALDTTDMNSGAAYGLAKRANALRVQAASMEWGDRGARLNSVSPGIILTPLAQDELNGPAGPAYQRMIAASAAGRVGTPDEVGVLGAFLMSRDAAFITGADFLIDGGVIASIATGRFEVSLGE
jgi:NAD(P)-dependent dehydrogenase (short-subunit alcohol dehydrogenase family)